MRSWDRILFRQMRIVRSSFTLSCRICAPTSETLSLHKYRMGKIFDSSRDGMNGEYSVVDKFSVSVLSLTSLSFSLPSKFSICLSCPESPRRGLCVHFLKKVLCQAYNRLSLIGGIFDYEPICLRITRGV